MNLESKIKFSGYSYELQGDIDFWGTTLESVRVVVKEEVDFTNDGTSVIESIKSKIQILQSLSLNTIKEVIEKETNKKIRNIKPVSISFDFAEPENEACSVDVYFSCGKIFGGFSTHIRIADNGNNITMVGLS